MTMRRKTYGDGEERMKIVDKLKTKLRNAYIAWVIVPRVGKKELQAMCNYDDMPYYINKYDRSHLPKWDEIPLKLARRAIKEALRAEEKNKWCTEFLKATP